MDHPHDEHSEGGRPPRKELQGPRPTPLKVRKESHKIKKPPVAPAPPAHHQQPPPPRKPVVIYTVSPKVIHTNPSDFMTLVQRLTGHDTATSSSSSSSMTCHVSEAMSPAARFASIEMTKMPLESKQFGGSSRVVEEEIGHEVKGGGGVERTVVFPGILSPGPGSLPQVSPNLFSSAFFHQDQTASNVNTHISNINLNHDRSAVQQYGTRSYMEGSYMPSPFSTNFVSPSTMFSPSSLDFLHNILDS